jgi:ParB-like chromosome segregation protein Spo0J
MAGFSKRSTVSILRLIQSDEPIDPIELWPFATDAFSYELADGYHRFYIAKTLGYTHIPADIMTWT